MRNWLKKVRDSGVSPAERTRIVVWSHSREAVRDAGAHFEESLGLIDPERKLISTWSSSRSADKCEISVMLKSSPMIGTVLVGS